MHAHHQQQSQASSPTVATPELGWYPVLMGCLLGILFGASSLYLALKVGMTVSASIPVAVLSITVFKGLSKALKIRGTTILENNIVQTTGSAGESIAFGVAVTMPALLILGFDMELSRILSVALLGGLLGVLMMIPLRKALIVDAQDTLKYPEGTACAEVLRVGEKGGTSAKTVFTGFFVGLIYKVANIGMRLWTDVPEKAISFFKGATLSAEVSPELLGVGYIIGPRIGAVMIAGGILSSWVLIPAIFLFGGGMKEPLFPATKLISEMAPHEVWKNYVLYIGAGAVATGGIISLFQSLPTIMRSAFAGLKSVRQAVGLSSSNREAPSRHATERDLPLSFVITGSALLVLALWLTPSLKINLAGAILILLFGFLFVTVSSRLTGEIGSSSNPISGMTVATLLLTSLIFLALGWVSPDDRVAALSIAAVVCVAASNGGTTSQDLKTGFLVGATPRAQQLSLLAGVITSASVIGFTLHLLNDAGTVTSKNIPQGVQVPESVALLEKEKIQGPERALDSEEYRVLRLREKATDGPLAALSPGKYLVDDAGVVKYIVDPGINGTLKNRDDGTPVQKFEAPKARLMSLIIDGILAQKLPWGLVLLGVAIAIMMELLGIPSLPFAVGVYLPLSSSVPVFLGGLLRGWMDRRAKKEKETSLAEEESSPGILYSSGLIAGGSIAGIVLALLSVKEHWALQLDFSSALPALSGSPWTAMGAFAVLMGLLALSASEKKSL
jgi:putative OPT family oligopeptide transporter